MIMGISDELMMRETLGVQKHLLVIRTYSVEVSASSEGWKIVCRVASHVKESSMDRKAPLDVV
jgi:hypothetical protein